MRSFSLDTDMVHQGCDGKHHPHGQDRHSPCRSLENFHDGDLGRFGLFYPVGLKKDIPDGVSYRVCTWRHFVVCVLRPNRVLRRPAAERPRARQLVGCGAAPVVVGLLRWPTGERQGQRTGRNSYCTDELVLVCVNVPRMRTC